MPGPRQTSEGRTVPPTDLAPRFAALTLLDAALSRRSGFEEAAATPGFHGLDLRDRAFARALALTTLRRLGALDARLNAKLRSPPPARVMSLLRLGAAQILHMDVPPFAAVSSTVEMSKAHPETRAMAGLVNAVLRGLAGQGPEQTPPSLNAPPWLYARWRAAYGEAAADRIALAISEEPPTDLSLRRQEDAQALAPALEARRLPCGSLRTFRRGEVSLWPGFEEGLFWVQDAAAATPARLLEPRPGERVLDLCAAPGGKTLQLAAAGARVLAVDRSAARLGRLRENLARTGLSAEVLEADALALPGEISADGVLLDAPCTATGTFRRHPEVLWASRPADVAGLAGVQAQLLLAAADRVRPGGRLVYCVCSLEPEEGEVQARAFLQARDDFSTSPAAPEALGLSRSSLTPEGWLRLLPDGAELGGGADGFFISRFTRRA